MGFLNKLEQLVFYFLIFAIPFQTRKILWRQNWYFNEWQALFIYGTDVLMIILFLFWFFRCFRGYKFLISNFKFLNKSQFQNPSFYLFLFVVISAISIKNSSNFYLSLFQFLKLIEFVAFYFYIKSYAVKNFDLFKSLYALIFGGLFQAVIAILQFVKQSDLNLQYLGESILRPDLNGVAVFFNSSGQRIMRAYGTTPHPNVLAAYLFLAIFAFYFAYLYYGLYHENRESVLSGWPILVADFITLLAFFFTFSRTIIFLWLLTFLIRTPLVLMKKNFRDLFLKVRANRVRLIKILAIGLLAMILVSVFYWPDVVSRLKLSSGDEAIQLRIFYNTESLKSLNLFGVGIGNFVNWLMVKDPSLPRQLYQPVHNIYLLIYSETGILGILSFSLFLVFLIKNYLAKTQLQKFYHLSFLIVALSFLAMGLFDHFLWTIQQGRLLFWITLTLLTYTESHDRV